MIRVPGNPKCPSCNAELPYAASIFNDKRFKPGDISVCAYCSELLEFDADLTLKLFPKEEFAKLGIESQHMLNVARRRLKAWTKSGGTVVVAPPRGLS